MSFRAFHWIGKEIFGTGWRRHELPESRKHERQKIRRQNRQLGRLKRRADRVEGKKILRQEINDLDV
jgi:hypothetical protein